MEKENLEMGAYTQPKSGIAGDLARVFDLFPRLKERRRQIAGTLSGGEQQRIAIARAILNKPKIIIADEPTGNLDPETAENIIRLLREISQTGTSVVMSTHNLPLLDKYPGIVYRCADGRLEEVTNDFNKIKMEFD